MKEIRLSKKQKEVVRLIKNGDKGTVYYKNWNAYFKGMSHPPTTTLKVLLKSGIIKVAKKREAIIHIKKWYKLTGKGIKIAKTIHQPPTTRE